MAAGIELTKDEQIAKDHFMFLIREAHKIPCDSDVANMDDSLPSWYDESLYKRGQKYYQQNRAGIMYSNLIGLICLLAEPRGLKILQSTGRSSTSKTARKRYISTVTHTVTWYDVDLTPGSKSFESLKKVRKLHYLSSKSAMSKGLGIISQADLAGTAFGFMGFVLIRPHILGIRADNIEDRKAFVHFWAVLCHMIGIEDRFNICLLPFDALLVFCQMVMRYVLLPIIQLETKDFKDMTKAMLKGMKPYLHNVNYEVDVFFAKHLLIVPGYQYCTDNALEVHCRSILTQDDVDECNKYIANIMGGIEKPYLSVDIPIIEVTKGHVNEVLQTDSVVVNVTTREGSSDDIEYLRHIMKLDPTEEVTVRYINYERDWQSCLSDSKFKELSSWAKFSIRMKKFMRFVYCSIIGWYLIESLIGFVLYRIKRANENYRFSRKAQTA